ncbi:lytic transglycosylase domain-containing protein [Croceibacterium aestuarii]|uniref:lytic transglycosylase domain-containing protein n=1 Tax=Croceibacterium aestuarii TaxID=3064139 RepID=UPI00272DFE53|nr:lytic transglycosylase domain-containing protein [Croceibacterium sp. D39]
MRRFVVPLSFLVAAAPTLAHADVLEIGSSGAAWISGGPTAEIAPTDAAHASLPDVTGLDVPEEAVASPLDSSAALPPKYRVAVRQLAARFDLSPALIEALVWQESRWHEAAQSPVGARGLAQLMPATAREMGVDADDPLANLEGGARYLRQQLDRFGGDIEKALAAYNAGPGRVERAGGVPRIRETQTYVAAIMGRLSDHSRSDN